MKSIRITTHEGHCPSCQTRGYPCGECDGSHWVPLTPRNVDLVGLVAAIGDSGARVEVNGQFAVDRYGVIGADYCRDHDCKTCDYMRPCKAFARESIEMMNTYMDEVEL